MADSYLESYSSKTLLDEVHHRIFAANQNNSTLEDRCKVAEARVKELEAQLAARPPVPEPLPTEADDLADKLFDIYDKDRSGHSWLAVARYILSRPVHEPLPQEVEELAQAILKHVDLLLTEARAVACFVLQRQQPPAAAPTIEDVLDTWDVVVGDNMRYKGAIFNLPVILEKAGLPHRHAPEPQVCPETFDEWFKTAEHPRPGCAWDLQSVMEFARAAWTAARTRPMPGEVK